MLAAARCLLASAAALGASRACPAAGAGGLLRHFPLLRQLMSAASSQSTPPCILPAHPPAPPEMSLCAASGTVPAEVWQLLASYFPDRTAHPPSCLSISGWPDGCEACTHSLQAAGFGDVTPLVLRHQGTGGPVEGRSDRCCLELPSISPGVPAIAAAAAAAVGAQQQQQQQRPRFDAVAYIDCLHLLDTRRALQAAHRHVRPLGLLAVLWTDRQLSSPLCLDLEELLEAHLPGYCRYAAQHDPADWLPRLQAGGLFRLVDFTAAPGALRLPGLHALADLLAGRGPLRAALGSSRRRAFHAELHRLVERRCGTAHAPLELPLVTKAYLLAARQGPAPQRGPSRSTAGGSALGPERVCLFCGREVAGD